MKMIVLKNEIVIIKEKSLNVNAEELKNYADVHGIDENSVGMNDALLWVKITRELIKLAKKVLNNDTCNLLNEIRRR